MSEEQPAIPIAQALEEGKVHIRFRALDSFSRMGVTLERDSAFKGPLTVIIPAGTCISPRPGGLLTFPSFSLPSESQEQLTMGESVELEAICLERWGAVPSAQDEDKYQITPPADWATDLSTAVSRLYQNGEFQALSDEERHEVLQDLVWFVNDRWIGWQSSPHRALIADAVQQTDLASELDLRYVLDLEGETFVNCKGLEGSLFPAEMYRGRNHLIPGEMMIFLPESGIVGVAHASPEERTLSLVTLPSDADNVLRSRYRHLAQCMRTLADLEDQGEALLQTLGQLQAIELLDGSQDERAAALEGRVIETTEGILDYLERFVPTVEAAEHHLAEVKRARLNLDQAYRSYSDSAAPAITSLMERHRSQIDHFIQADGGMSADNVRTLTSLCRHYQGDVDQIRETWSDAADFLSPAWLLMEIQRRVGPFPPTVLVKVSHDLGKLHLQAVYDCLHKAGVQGFESPARFVILETAAPPSPSTLPDDLDRLATVLDDLLPGATDTSDPAALMELLEQAKTEQEALGIALNLVKLGEQGVAALIGAVGHLEAPAHGAALLALVKSATTALPQLLDALHSHDPQQRHAIAAVLHLIGEPALEPLLSSLSSSDAYQRAGAMLTLRLFSEEQAESIPWASLGDSVVAQLVNDISHPDEEIASVVMTSLPMLGNRVIDPLIQGVTQASEADADKFLAAFPMIGEPAIEPLLRLLRSASEQVRWRAVTALSIIGEPAIKPLIGLMASPSEDVALNATVALATIGDAAREPLQSLLRSGTRQQRIRAMAALEMIEGETS